MRLEEVLRWCLIFHRRCFSVENSGKAFLYIRNFVPFLVILRIFRVFLPTHTHNRIPQSHGRRPFCEVILCMGGLTHRDLLRNYSLDKLRFSRNRDRFSTFYIMLCNELSECCFMSVSIWMLSIYPYFPFTFG